MLDICIFSYNRGAFLKNCLASIQQYAPQCSVRVFDDNSDDPSTQDVLSSLPDGVSLYQPSTDGKTRHGDLYANMQWALTHSRPGAILLFIQDDMQLVRPLRDEDYQYIHEFYARFSQAAFLNPVFLKGQRRRRDQRITSVDQDFPVYFRHYPEKKHPRGISYADVVIAHADRLRAVDWKFSGGEVQNALQAQQHFGKMGFMLNPFVMFLPQVPVYRGKQKSTAVNWAERLSGHAPKAFHPMDTPSLDALFTRAPEVLPVAEDFLTCQDSGVKTPFQYSAVNAYPLLRALHKIEQWLGR